MKCSDLAEVSNFQGKSLENNQNSFSAHGINFLNYRYVSLKFENLDSSAYLCEVEVWTTADQNLIQHCFGTNSADKVGQSLHRDNKGLSILYLHILVYF